MAFILLVVQGEAVVGCLLVGERLARLAAPGQVVEAVPEAGVHLWQETGTGRRASREAGKMEREGRRQGTRKTGRESKRTEKQEKGRRVRVNREAGTKTREGRPRDCR